MRSQRALFSIPRGTTYLNCAYMSPLPKRVELAGQAGLRRKRNPAVIEAADFYRDADSLRKEFAGLLGAQDPRRIVIVPSVSYGLANVTRNIRLKGTDKIIVAAGQFPSNYYPWQSLSVETGCLLQAISPPDSNEGRGRKWNERLLDAIDSQTRLVALGNVHWADGTKFDLAGIRKRTREVGALLIVDGTQSIGAMPFDFAGIAPDALVCAGYKWLMGPYSIGLAYYGEHFDKGKPVEENWINRIESENFAGLVNYKDDYQPGALRYEVGEHSNFILVPMMRQALGLIRKWQPAHIQTYCRVISQNAVTRLRNAGFWIEEDNLRGHHLFGIRFSNSPSLNRIREKLKRKKIFVSIRGDSIRVSLNVYNSADDLDRLANILLS